ncbi:PilZ domain-containing protein [Candidatus Omnitrophota bacterium]
MERRQFERLSINNFVTYKRNRFSPSIECMTSNISLRGACILTENKLEPQKNIRLKLFYGPKIGAKEVVSKVIYSKPVEDKLGKGYVNGVEFSKSIFSDRKELFDNEL